MDFFKQLLSRLKRRSVALSATSFFSIAQPVLSLVIEYVTSVLCSLSCKHRSAISKCAYAPQKPVLFVRWLNSQSVGPSRKRLTIHTTHLLAYMALTIFEGVVLILYYRFQSAYILIRPRSSMTCPFVGWLVSWSHKHPTPKI